MVVMAMVGDGGVCDVGGHCDCDGGGGGGGGDGDGGDDDDDADVFILLFRWYKQVRNYPRMR